MARAETIPVRIVDHRSRFAGLRPSNNRRVRGLALPMAFHVGYMTWYGLLIGMVSIKYQNSMHSPFKTHLVSMQITVAAMCVYGFAVALKKKFKREIQRRNCSKIFSHVILISGGLMSASLVSVLVPTVPDWIVYVVWGIFVVIVVAGNWMLWKTIVNAPSQLLNKFASFWQHRSIEENGSANV